MDEFQNKKGEGEEVEAVRGGRKESIKLFAFFLYKWHEREEEEEEEEERDHFGRFDM